MKYLVLFSLLFSTVIYCQPGGHKRGENFQQTFKLKPTIQVLPASYSEILVSYIYRIPHNRLIFEKSGNTFSSSVRIQVEVYNGDEFIEREFVDKHISVEDFELVKSKSASVQGIIQFKLSNKYYKIKGVATDLNSQIDIPIQTIKLDVEESVEKGIYQPIIINAVATDCDGFTLPVCVNGGGSIPFSSSGYDLIIPLSDTSISSIRVEIKSDTMDTSNSDVTDYYAGDINFIECNGRIFIGSDNTGIRTRNFILKDINKKLSEGKILVRVKINQDDYLEFPMMIEWLNKPISLRDPEFAIKMLKYIDDETRIAELLNADEKEYPEILHEYWKKYDPTPETEFNELMEEFYSRIDYAAMEFRGINKKDGLSTDRGRIYIKNGKPDNIERFSNDNGYIVETWTYNATGKVFQFIDKQGTGNFILIEG